MGQRLKVRLFVLLIVTLSVFLVDRAFATDDWGMVVQTILKHKVNKRLTLVIFPEVRFNDDAKNFYYQQYRGGIEYLAYKFLDLGISYEYITVKNSAGKWVDENRLVFLGSPHWKLAGLDFCDKNRIEVRELGHEYDHFRYRNEFIIEKSVSLFSCDLKPFVSVEPWYDLLNDRVDFIRYQVGFSKSINKNFSYSLFYRSDDSNKGKENWVATGYVGVKTVIKY